MSYQSQTQLAEDAAFQARVRACSVQQANTYKDSALPNYVALANAILRQEDKQVAFFTISAAAPGIADKADNGDGTVDQSKVTDADLLSIVQGSWPVVADLYYAEDGSPLNAE
jgi:hypothetical protein